MPRKLPPNPNEKPQFERFIEAAKKVGAADTDANLQDTIKKIARSDKNVISKRSVESRD